MKSTENTRGLRGIFILAAAALALMISAFAPVRTEAETTPARRIILIGDSRTEGMHQFIGTRSGVVWRYKSGMGLVWMKNTGVPGIESKIRKNTAVVILMGVNDVLDLWQTDNYASYINAKAKAWKAKGADTYYVSLTPVDNKKDKYEKNKNIRQWNARIRKQLSSDVTYVNIYSKMLTDLETTSDGLHYQRSSSVKYFNLVYNAVKNPRNDDTDADLNSEAYYRLVYNFADYMRYNSDLRKLYLHDREGAFDHFLHKGMAEGRRGSVKFDPVSYRLEYRYLRQKFGNDWKEYYLHYIQKGYRAGYKATGRTTMRQYAVIYKGTSYSRVYDYNYFVRTHPAVFREYEYDDQAVLKYFVTSAMKRGHRASPKFDWKAYKKYNSDLAAKFGNNYAQYYIHYITEGWKQNRRAV